MGSFTGSPWESRWAIPGEPKMSSRVPKVLSGPGCAPILGSAPPAEGMWQVPQAMVLSEESCSSQKRIFPRMGSVNNFL